MTIRIRGLPASFGISKLIAGLMTIAFAGTPSFPAASQSRIVGPCTTLANHKPVVNPSAVAQGHSTTQVVLCCEEYQLVRLLGGTNKELCDGEVLLRAERDGEPRDDPQVRRQIIDELLRGSHRRNVPVHHEAVDRWLEVLARAASSTHKSTLSSMVWNSRARASWPLRTGQEGDQNHSTQTTATALTSWTTPSTNARIPRVQNRELHLRGRRQG